MMDRMYGFFLTLLLMGCALIANLLTYLNVGGDFFLISMFLLAVFFFMGLFFYTTVLGQLCSLALFSVTLLTGVIMFHTLFPAAKETLALLLFVGIVGFVVSVPSEKRKTRRRQMPIPMPLPEPNPALGGLTSMQEMDTGEFLELHEVDKLIQKKSARKKAPRKQRH